MRNQIMHAFYIRIHQCTTHYAIQHQQNGRRSTNKITGPNPLINIGEAEVAYVCMPFWWVG